MFGAVPGEMFVVRNIAGIVPPYEPETGGHHGTSAAIEFGVRVLKVSRLVVLGHAQCGGVRAMALGAPPEARDFLASWVDIAKPAINAARGDEAHAPGGDRSGGRAALARQSDGVSRGWRRPSPRGA